MKILGVGLSRTGTLSLSRALEILGFRTLHWCPERLRDVVLGQTASPDFRRYDDVDAVTDLPAALFYQELLEVYPNTKCILTTRPEEDWLRSVRRHYQVSVPEYLKGQSILLEEARRTQEFAYGSSEVVPFLYLKRYQDHNRLVQHDIPANQLLVMDLKQNMGWEPLCEFLGVSIPNEPFPHTNQSSSSMKENGFSFSWCPPRLFNYARNARKMIRRCLSCFHKNV